jgi:hypothetical protein
MYGVVMRRTDIREESRGELTPVRDSRSRIPGFVYTLQTGLTAAWRRRRSGPELETAS